ncbi:MAG: protein translocase subunit SecD [Bordetella sp.]|nr:MAG: protein translocase subunit SecD [Bordetella sp.]
MNRFSLWKYLYIFTIVLISIFYITPNFFEKKSVIQISNVNKHIAIHNDLLIKVKNILLNSHIEFKDAFFDKNKETENIIIDLDFDKQIYVRNLLDKELNLSKLNYTVNINSIPEYPNWMKSFKWIMPNPLTLGLDLRGGAFFLLKVDMISALKNQSDSIRREIEILFRNKKIPYKGIELVESSIISTFQKIENRDKAFSILKSNFSKLTLSKQDSKEKFQLIISFPHSEILSIQKHALQKNISILRNRVNELGVSEPIIQQRGSDKILVQLPGFQDVEKAKKLLGRTATLELRLVNESFSNSNFLSKEVNTECYKQRNGLHIFVDRKIILSGDNIRDAQPGRDLKHQQVTINLTLDEKGKRIFQTVTRDNIGKRMAIILFENGEGEVVTAPIIRSEIFGGQVQISGALDMQEAAEIALILRSGSLTAPISVIEEKIIGPTLGSENIKKGIKSTIYGMLAVIIFIISYYRLIGLFSIIGLLVNTTLLLALLAMLQATLTLPGIAAIALTLGMAIDSNVLINERILEELRNGLDPQKAIYKGFNQAWNTILDSNSTSFIVGLGLLIFSSGSVRGFAIVHCLGILTSIFSSVLVVRALVNLMYGHKKTSFIISV